MAQQRKPLKKGLQRLAPSRIAEPTLPNLSGSSNLHPLIPLAGNVVQCPALQFARLKPDLIKPPQTAVDVQQPAFGAALGIHSNSGTQGLNNFGNFSGT